MKTMVSRLPACLAPFLLLTIGFHSALAVQLNMPAEIQEKSEWCWAASCQMVLEYYGVSKTQTELAEWVFVLAENEPLPLYNSVASTKRGVNLVLDNYAGDDIGRQYYDAGTLAKQHIFDEIDKESPITILGQTDWGTPALYHIIVIIGYIDDSQTNPTIIVNDPTDDPDWGGRREMELTYLQRTSSGPYPWEWQETLRLEKSGFGGTGIFDGVSITETDFTYTEPAAARQYEGHFVRSYGSNAYATNWLWELSFNHTGGEYVVATHEGPNYPTLSTSWYAPSFTLPSGYDWYYTNDGAAIGTLKLSCVDTDGYYHDDMSYIYYYPSDPYAMNEVYAYSSVSGTHPDVRAHHTIILQDYAVQAGADIAFKAGVEIEIRDNVTIANGSACDLIVDPSLR